MLKAKKISIFMLSMLLSFTAYGSVLNEFSTSSATEVSTNDKVKTISIYVNSNRNYKIQMKDVPKVGYLEVYTVLGVKVKSVSLGSFDVEYDGLSLPKGIYILRAGKVAQKIIVSN